MTQATIHEMVYEELVSSSPFYEELSEKQKRFVTDKLVALITAADVETPLSEEEAQANLDTLKAEALAL